MTTWLALTGSALAGGLFTLAIACNARLQRSLGSPIRASAVSFTVSFLFISLLALLGVLGVIQITSLTRAPWWSLSGGALGSLSIVLSLIAIPKIGLAAISIALVFGQLGFSLLIEQFGFSTVVGGGLSPSKILGVILILLAVVLIQDPQLPERSPPDTAGQKPFLIPVRPDVDSEG